LFSIAFHCSFIEVVVGANGGSGLYEPLDEFELFFQQALTLKQPFFKLKLFGWDDRGLWSYRLNERSLILAIANLSLNSRGML
jgi:hypothetical protein